MLVDVTESGTFSPQVTAQAATHWSGSRFTLSFSASRLLSVTHSRNSIFASRLLSVALMYRGSTGGSGISLNQIQLNRQLTGQEIDFRFSFFSVLPSATRTQQEGREFYVHVILILKTIDMVLSP